MGPAGLLGSWGLGESVALLDKVWEMGHLLSKEVGLASIRELQRAA